MYTYLDSDGDNELVDSLKSNSLKAVKFFQKPYYKEPIKGELISVPSWRLKEKMKTGNAALIMCLNIGVDPPDIVKSNQCSKLECWISELSFDFIKFKFIECCKYFEYEIMSDNCCFVVKLLFNLIRFFLYNAPIFFY